MKAVFKSPLVTLSFRAFPLVIAVHDTPVIARLDRAISRTQGDSRCYCFCLRRELVPIG
ncbi:MAG: hypothetical protein IJ727_07125 [Treponema sp.]|nr:hypothetical protein [Treponema sp.]